MEVFGIAVSSDVEHRDAYLDRACVGNAELRAEVDSLLAIRARLGDFLNEPTVDVDALTELQTDAADDAANDPSPTIIGPYRILDRLGEGGFGVVYRARQEEPFRREVALKLIKLGMDSRRIIARFEAERQALALMDHPNIARIFDAGTAPDGRPYFVMERVNGTQITDYCDMRCSGVTERLNLFLGVCQAVQHAHTKGMIHRDLKPSNILVAQIDEAPVPKVIDFGIAHAITGTSGRQMALTELRLFLGTPHYMSPEQGGAGNGDIDTRSDIYSLGILLYELLTSVTPFDAPSSTSESNLRVDTGRLEQEPARPSVRLGTLGPLLDYAAARRGLNAQKLRRCLSGELDWIVMKAIERDRSRRYETAAALADDVRRYLADEPLVACPPSTWYRAKKFAHKRRGVLLAAAAVVCRLGRHHRGPRPRQTRPRPRPGGFGRRATDEHFPHVHAAIGQPKPCHEPAGPVP
jgi:hypothetical protein